MKAVEAVVVGAGPAGCAASLALALRGVETLLIEARSTTRWKAGETLSPETRPLLQELGVWEQFQGQLHLPAWGQTSSWGGDSIVDHDFIHNLNGPAWQLDRPAFENLLCEEAGQAGVITLRGTPVQRTTRKGKLWHLEIGNEKVRARWLLDATGRASSVARQFGARRRAVDNLVSLHLVATEPQEPDKDARTLLESRPDGWWYSALTPGARRIIAWQTDAETLASQRHRRDTWFRSLIRETQHVNHLLSRHRYDLTKPIRVTAARSDVLNPPAGPGWLALGDAAAAFDPLSGQGIFFALLSGINAAEVVAAGSEAPELEYTDWYDQVWRRYLQDRRYFYATERRWPDHPFWRGRSTHINA